MASLSQRYAAKLAKARECRRICQSWRETVTVPSNESPYAFLNDVRAHLLCVRAERMYARAAAVEADSRRSAPEAKESEHE
jgi:hypothetical protein